MADDTKTEAQTSKQAKTRHDVDKRRELFAGAIENIERHISRDVTGRIFGLGDSARFEIDRKCRPSTYKSSRSPSKSDLLAAQLLEILSRDGYDLDKMMFDTDGKLVKLPRE